MKVLMGMTGSWWGEVLKRVEDLGGFEKETSLGEER